MNLLEQNIRTVSGHTISCSFITTHAPSYTVSEREHVASTYFGSCVGDMHLSITKKLIKYTQKFYCRFSSQKRESLFVVICYKLLLIENFLALLLPLASLPFGIYEKINL